MPIEFFRGVVGIIGVGCAFMAGRALIDARRGLLKPGRTAGWFIRLILCLGAVAIRHPVDSVDLIIWSLSAIAFALGCWVAAQRKQPEDLTHEIFPGEP